MNLTIDIGNSQTKMAIIEDGQVVDTFKFEQAGVEHVASVLDAYPAVEAAIMVCSRDGGDELAQYVRRRVGRFLEFTTAVSVPLANLYRTPQTLGADRLAAAVGASALYPGANVLVVDFGTAITIDMVSSRGQYLGGNISPGARMRFRALNSFTDRLPMGDLTEVTELLGTCSINAVESGVVNGIVYEIEGYINRLTEKKGEIKIIFTGGDGNFFAGKFKNPIFATYDLVAYGLNRILEYNADSK